MASDRKFMIRVFEIMAVLGSTVTSLLMYYVSMGAIALEMAGVVVIGCMCMALAISFVSFSLWEEYAKVLRGEGYDPNDENSLSGHEFGGLIEWSPPIFKLALPLAIICGVGCFWWWIMAESSAGNGGAPNIELGMMSLANMFQLLSLPILASASRMPGRFCDNFTSGDQIRK